MLLSRDSLANPGVESFDTIKIKVTEDNKLPYDPTTSGFAHITFYNAVLGRMVSLSQNLTTQPSLLESAYWDYEKNGYILRLKPSLKFHNGREVVAEDVYFSLVRFFLTTKRADPAAYLKNIDGVETLKRGEKYVPWAVRGIKRMDSKTVFVQLSHPNPAFLYSLADGWASIVPKEELKNDLTTWKTFPIGAGPYRVIRVAKSSVSVAQTAPVNPHAPVNVEFTSDPNSIADITGLAATGESFSGLKKVYGEGPIGFTGLFFNRNSSLGSNALFRRAISLAIQRAEFSRINSDFSPLNELLPSNFAGRLNLAERYDIATSKKILSQIPNDKFPSVLKAYWFTGRSTLTATDRKVLDAVNRQLASIGLTFEFRNSQTPTFEETDSETILRLDDRGTAFPDPLVLFRSYDFPGFLSPFFPRDAAAGFKPLLEQASEATSLDQKANAMEKLSKYFYDNNIIVPLYERKTVFWINPKSIEDLGLQTGITIDLGRVKLKKLQ